MPTMRSAKRRARSTLWMLTIAGMSRSPARRAISSMISTEVLGSSDEVGSSASSEVGFLHQRARNADALALPAGELVGALGGKVAEADGVEQVEGAVRRRCGGKLAQPCAPDRHVAEPAAQHVLDHREPLDQIVLLEHHAACGGARVRNSPAG